MSTRLSLGGAVVPALDDHFEVALHVAELPQGAPERDYLANRLVAEKMPTGILGGWSLDDAVDALAEDYSYDREAYPEIPSGLGDMLEELAQALTDMGNSRLDANRVASAEIDANLHGAHADSVREDLVAKGIHRFLGEHRSAA